MQEKYCETAILFRRYVCSSCIFSCALLSHTRAHTHIENSQPQTAATIASPENSWARQTLSICRTCTVSVFVSALALSTTNATLVCRLHLHARLLRIVYEQCRYIGIGVRVRSPFPVCMFMCVCIRILSNFENFLYIWWRQRRLLYSQETRVCRKL